MDKMPHSQFEKLKTAVDWSITQMQTPREKRHEALKEFVGSHYADGGSEKRVPTNFLELAVSIYLRQLAARVPRCLITAKKSRFVMQAKEMELAINQVPAEIGLDKTFRRAVMEALFAFGVVKVGISKTGNAMGHDYGEVFVDIVSLDNYFCDMSAKTYDAIQYEGNDYWLSLEEVKESEFYQNTSELEADEPSVTDGETGTDKSNSISVDEGGDVLHDQIHLRDTWLPAENRMVTYAVTSGKQIGSVEWDGPGHGPYYRLGYTEVPGNLLPLPPVALWRDLHELGNALFRKLANQADSQKTVQGFSGGNDEDVERFKNAKDGSGIKYSGGKPEPLTAGGIDQVTLAFYLQSKDQFSYLAGNLDMLGGLSPMSDTVGQDKILSDAASSRIRDMSEQTVSFIKDVYKAIAWYEWTDPIRTRMITKSVPDLDVSISIPWSKETRDGDFLDYEFDIDVYTMQDDSPSMKLQKLNFYIQQILMPLMPFIQQQGGEVDFKKLNDLLMKYSNLPELESVITFPGKTVPQQTQGNPSPSVQPSQTTRTYERVNRPGATRSGKDQAMSQLLMGGDVQNSEKESLFRGTG